MKLKSMVVFFIISMTAVFLMAERYKDRSREITLIKDPKPTCFEKEYVELEKVGEVIEDLNSEDFLVAPWSAVADSNGNVYVFDSMMGKIFKFDENLKLTAAFGSKGRGPGQFGGIYGRGGYVYLYIDADDIIYAGDKGNSKIICFDTSGKVVREFRVNETLPYVVKPAIDSKGNVFLHSARRGIIDKFDKNGRYLSTLGNYRTLATALFRMNKKPITQRYTYFYSDTRNVVHEILPDDRLAVFVMTSGYLYIVKDDKVLLKKPLWPKNFLNIYKKEIKTTMEEDGMGGFWGFFQEMKLDYDNQKYLYLFVHKPMGDTRGYIYQFDLEGNLVCVFYVKEHFELGASLLLFKRNGLFYMRSRNKDFNNTLMTFRIPPSKANNKLQKH